MALVAPMNRREDPPWPSYFSSPLTRFARVGQLASRHPAAKTLRAPPLMGNAEAGPTTADTCLRIDRQCIAHILTAPGFVQVDLPPDGEEVIDNCGHP